LVEIKVSYTDDADQSVPLPIYASAGAAGADVRANLADKGQITLAPGTRALIATGLCFEIPDGFEVQLRPRSGLALKHGITLANTPGTIDSDYRGPVGVILLNAGAEDFTVTHGDRIAQMVVAPVTRARFTMADSLSDTDRSDNGFGSTGRA
jgi:dUTP pyrophosphatase